MFETLTNRISQALGSLRGPKVLSEKAIDETLRQVRRSLIEADVALPVTQDFISQVRTRVTGREVASSLTPDQTVISIVHEELTRVMGGANVPLESSPTAPSIILVAGLQGSGKTTTVGKLAKFLVEQEGKKVLVGSVDIYRPAAIDQLRRLSEMVGVDFFETDVKSTPGTIAEQMVADGKKRSHDYVIVDSAGRLHIDHMMMDELKSVHSTISPSETLFVIDAMTGQDAVNSASAFNEALPLTGVVVTKLDSDTRGGALISVRHVTGKPVKFIGVGEGTDALERFHPDRLASRILGMGDVMSLIETVQQKSDKEKTEKLAKKITRGKRFDLEDYRDQMLATQKMGGISSLVEKMPGMSSNQLPKLNQLEADVKREIAIINSMTPHERQHPAVIRGTRRARISAGAGVESRFVNQLLRKYEKMQRMTRKMKGGKFKGKNTMPGMENLKGRLPLR